MNVSDTTPPTLLEILDFNESFDIDGGIVQGEDVKFNVTVSDDVRVKSVVYLREENETTYYFGELNLFDKG